MKYFNNNHHKLSKNTHVLLIILMFFGATLGFFGVSMFSKPISSTATSGCNGICVALKPSGMEPNELAIKAGETVQFNSADGAMHNLAKGGGLEGHGSMHHDHLGGFVSGEFAADEAWRVQFKKPGTYQLHDHYNPRQNILIVVYEES
jgi:plastocyanin